MITSAVGIIDQTIEEIYRLGINTVKPMTMAKNIQNKITKKFTMMYVHTLVFNIICSLTYFHIKLLARIHSAKSILLAFLVNTNHFGCCVD